MPRTPQMYKREVASITTIGIPIRKRHRNDEIIDDSHRSLDRKLLARHRREAACDPKATLAGSPLKEAGLPKQ